MSTTAKRSRLRSKSGLVLLGLLLWVALGMHIVHPLLHWLNGDRNDLRINTGHGEASSPESAAVACPHIDSAVPGGYAGEPCPVWTFIARTGSWIGTCVPVLAPAIVLGSHLRPPDSRFMPPWTLLSYHSRAPPTASSLPV